MHIEVKQLSETVRRALSGVGYGARDVEIIAAESVPGYSEGGAGQRGFLVALNLDTGASKRVNGSWGGANMFTQSPVDHDDTPLPVPVNGVYIKGTTGHPRTFARIYAHPSTVGRFLPSGAEETLTKLEQQALYCFGALKGGEFRREELARRGVSSDVVDSLVQRGYLKRNRAGATQITTQGKNARTIRN